jgi:hypothetical protein
LTIKQLRDRDETAGVGNPSQLIELNRWLWVGESGVADEEKVAMKKALLLVAVLTFSLPCLAQVADRASASGGASGQMHSAPARPAGASWVHFDRGGFDSFDSNLVVGTSGWASSSSGVASGPRITVYGSSAPWYPSAGQASSDWTFMQFGQPGAARANSPSLGAIARAAREAKAQDPRPLVKIRQDDSGKAVIVNRKQ